MRTEFEIDTESRMREALCAVARFRLAASCGLLVALVVFAIAHAQAQSALHRYVGTRVAATVTSITDGDTVHVTLADGSAVIIRLDGIDSPERGEPFSDRATRETRVLLLTKRVQVQGKDVDRYGRLVARLVVDGVDVSTQLVRDGLACHFTRYSSDATLAAAQKEAQQRVAGFWAQGAPKPACAVGTMKTQAPAGVAGPFHGNTSSHVYHAPGCPNYSCRNCSRVFTSGADAEAAGFRPAGDCLR